jgi:hypothetical protein
VSFRALLVAVGVASAGCGLFGGGGSGSGPAGGGALVPAAPKEQAKCRVAASQSSPLVTEWPASEKANLEALLGSGGVAVAYSGCAMRVLPQCRPRGSYRWQRTTPATDVIDINDADELYAKLPLGAASLEGELKRSGKLSVTTTVAGQMKLEGAAMAELAADPSCASATHVVTALSVGAFALNAGGSASGKVNASVTVVGEARASRERSEGLVRAAGNAENCNDSTAEAAHANCRSPIQVFLQALPGRGVQEGPPGTVKVNFVSESDDARWDVYSNDQVICTTPCTKFVDPLHPVTLRARDSSIMFMSPDRVKVARLGDQGTSLLFEAHPTARGRFMTGMAVGGVGLMVTLMGAMLAATSCGQDEDDVFDRGDRCKPSLIAMGIGVPVALVGAWLALGARPYAEVRGSE